MKKIDFKKLKTGDKVIVNGTEDDRRFTAARGVVSDGFSTNGYAVTYGGVVSVKFNDGFEWAFGANTCRKFNITVERETVEVKPAAPKRRPHGKQEYRGNGKHEWEIVTGSTVRLRVPGGWLYGKRLGHGAVLADTTFVPVPQAVGYAV